MIQDLQFDNNGRLKHFLTIKGLPAELFLQVLDTAKSFIPIEGRRANGEPMPLGRRQHAKRVGGLERPQREILEGNG
jgi:aspartate carbamoyltransferase catalytic subunit